MKSWVFYGRHSGELLIGSWELKGKTPFPFVLLIEALRWFDIFTMFFLLAVKGLLVRPKNFQLWRVLWMIKLQKSPVSCLKLLNWIKSKSLSLVLNISYSPLSRIVSVYFFFWSILKFAVLKCSSTFSHGLDPSTSRKAVRRPTTQTGGSLTTHHSSKKINK